MSAPNKQGKIRHAPARRDLFRLLLALFSHRFIGHLPVEVLLSFIERLGRGAGKPLLDWGMRGTPKRPVSPYFGLERERDQGGRGVQATLIFSAVTSIYLTCQG